MYGKYVCSCVGDGGEPISQPPREDVQSLSNTIVYAYVCVCLFTFLAFDLCKGVCVSVGACVSMFVWFTCAKAGDRDQFYIYIHISAYL